MDLSTMTPGTTMKFPLSVKMETTKQNLNECALDSGPLALTLVNGKRTTAVQLNHVPYAPGGINYAETGGDVISGIFTGCVMTIYTRDNRRRVAHVHTGEDAGAGLDCKNLMKSLVGGSGNNLVFAFKPYERDADYDSFLKIAKTSPLADRGVATFGLVTAANKCYSLFTRKVTPYEYVIEEVKEKLMPYQFS